MIRRRHQHLNDHDEGVPMSPLIDCVFLLLIFFLVTTMIKRKEKLIPIRLPDMSSSVSHESKDQTLILGLDVQGNAYHTDLKQKDKDGSLRYFQIDHLETWLSELVNKEGREILERPLRIDADRETPFQIAVDTIDQCKLAGFYDVGIKTRKRRL